MDREEYTKLLQSYENSATKIRIINRNKLIDL